MRAILVASAKKTGYVFASMVIALAFLVSASRLLSPVFNQHRLEIEGWATSVLQMPVTIGDTELSWSVYQPMITLNNVILSSKESKQPVLKIEKIKIYLSVIQSLWQRQAVPSTLIVEGTQLDVIEGANKSIMLQGMPALYTPDQGAEPVENQNKEMLQWLFSQSRFVLKNIEIHFKRANGSKYFVTLHNLMLQNKGERHTVLGKAILHQDVATAATLAIQWKGSEFDLNKIDADIYSYVSGLNFAQWFKTFNWNGWQVQQGLGSAKLWATWNHGVFNKVQATFQLYGLELFAKSDKENHAINRVSGNVGWERRGQEWIFAGNDILIDWPDHLWPVTSFYISLNQNAQGVFTPKIANFGYLDLQDVKHFLISTPQLLTAKQIQTLTELKLQGNIQNVSAVVSGPLDDQRNISLAANFNHFSLPSWGGIPSISNLSGSLKWNRDAGEIVLNSNQTKVYPKSVYTNPVYFDQLLGKTTVKWEPNRTWYFKIDQLQVLNHDASANVTGSFTVLPDGNVVTDLTANASFLQANSVVRYLPLRYFGPTLSSWLKQAFISGKINSLNAVMKGSWQAFPYDHGEGLFTLNADVKDINLKYAPDWPELKGINGNVSFIGRKMQVDAQQATLFNIPLTNVHAEMADTSAEQPVLKVSQTEIPTDLSQALNFIRQSPLANSIGYIFKGLDLKGPMQLSLALSVPINEPAKTQVQGGIHLNDSLLQAQDWQLDLEHLNGFLQFTENSLTGENIQGELFGKPVQLKFTTTNEDKKNIITTQFSTQLAISDLEKWLHVSLAKIANGSANVNAKLRFADNEPVGINLQSDLVGVSLNLPEEFSKSANEVRKLTAEILAQGQAPVRVRAKYGDLFSAAVLAERKENKFAIQGVNLQLGNGFIDWPKTTDSGLYITGELNDLDWDKIQRYSSGTDDKQTLKLRGINIKTKKLQLAGQVIERAALEVKPGEGLWNIHINSPEVDGRILVPTKFNRQGVLRAQFEKLALSSTGKNSKDKLKLDVNNVPAIRLSINKLVLDGKTLGEVYLRSNPAQRGMNIENFRINSSQMNLNAAGTWTQTKREDITRLKGRFTSTNVSKLLSNFGFDVRNFVSSNGIVNFNVSWHAAPFLPETASLNGDVRLAMGPGRIVDVGQASEAKLDLGRMLSVFSLQTIPRRLTLNFSDLSQKGYSFDNVRGDFIFKNGNAYTENLRLDGTLARVSINGRIGLSNKDYDFTLSVTPYNVTAPLPIAATLLAAANPVVGVAAIGIAAFAANSVIEPQVAKAITYYYSVSGPWNNPTWTPVSR